MFFYSDAERESNPSTLPDVEVFYLDAEDNEESGYYWWFCFPGCLPAMQTAFGPFASQTAAIIDARGDLTYEVN